MRGPEAAFRFLPLTCQSLRHILRLRAGTEPHHAATQPERKGFSMGPILKALSTLGCEDASSSLSAFCAKIKDMQ